MDERYSWVNTHKKITQYLSTKENSQQELINLLKSVNIGPFNDKTEDGEYDIELDEIDPFTFFCYIHKYGDKKRLVLLQNIAEKLDIEKPFGESGIPTAQAQKVWLFPFKYLRVNNEIYRLWNLFKKALKSEITDDDFADVLQIKNVGKTKLTEALFYINPEKYLPINGPTKPYIKEVFGINPKFNTYNEYRELLEKIKEQTAQPFYELSYEAWKWNIERKKVNYWVFQGNPNVFDFKTALQDEVLTSWTVTAHKDKIKTGDKVILWITGSKSGCYALAEVTSEPQHKNFYPDSHLWRVEDKNELKADINITHNLVDNPLLKDEIDQVEELSNLKVGNQGTNFSATDKQYKAILELIEHSDKFEETKNKFDFEYGTTFFESFIDKLRRIVSELNLQPNDERIVYSVRFNRFNFTIGQRYCFNIHLKYSNGVYGFISTEKLRDNIYYYKGTPKAFYNYCNDFNLNSKEWKSMIDAMNIELKRTTKSSYYQNNNNKEFEEYVFEDSSQSITHVEPMNYPLNTIFYGPPGTGKTYNTVLRAAEIVEGRTIESYTEALKVFKEKLHDQIEFITFHQNYSYEDFIQGLRPDTENDKDLIFERRDGVFKVLADKALANLLNAESKKTVKLKFEEVYKKVFLKLIEGRTNEFEIKMKKSSFYVTNISEKSIEFRKQNGESNHTLSLKTLAKMYEKGFNDIISGGLQPYYDPLLELLLNHGESKKEKVEKKNYVIIIDEINRANISRVFGELITLIEPDKRSHGAIPLETQLPSGDPFIVPSNLYIIGTMNTADKSIALLDIALRRRFDFEAMYPLYEIEGQEIHDVDVLRKLNEQIIKSKGHDFQIGHAYFMANNKTLTERMNNKIIPLLLEYYMNDEKEVKGIIQTAGLAIEEDKWPLRITGRND